MSAFRKVLVVLVALASPFVSPGIVFAHSVGTSYLNLSQSAPDATLTLQLDLHLRDIELAVGVDADGDGAITWRELTAAREELAAYIARDLHVSRDARACALVVDEVLVDELADGVYAVFRGRAICESSGELAIRSDMMFAVDAQHRTLVSFSDGGPPSVNVLTIDERTWRAPLGTSMWSTLRRFIVEGVHHIWTGFDHLAFLLILLLPALIAEPAIARARDRPVRRVLWIITAFTLAHSITLALAVLGYVKLPERPVEIAIAISVILAALANLNAHTRRLGPATAFTFGLLHGFGFASALGGLNLTQAGVGTALAGFNLGVELGQLAIVALVLPLLHLIRHTRFYVMKLVPAGSVTVAGLGTVWLLQRLA
jgi:hypothetical protein